MVNHSKEADRQMADRIKEKVGVSLLLHVEQIERAHCTHC
jgi:hypothetical protein